MKKYEYKFVEVPKKSGIKGHGSTFTECPVRKSAYYPRL